MSVESRRWTDLWPEKKKVFAGFGRIVGKLAGVLTPKREIELWGENVG